jgi:hypothetical protein
MEVASHLRIAPDPHPCRAPIHPLENATRTPLTDGFLKPFVGSSNLSPGTPNRKKKNISNS